MFKTRQSYEDRLLGQQYKGFFTYFLITLSIYSLVLHFQPAFPDILFFLVFNIKRRDLKGFLSLKCGPLFQQDLLHSTVEQ
jgi:hypothetical protein